MERYWGSQSLCITNFNTIAGAGTGAGTGTADRRLPGQAGQATVWHAQSD